MIPNIFRSPEFDNENDNFRAVFVNGFAWVGIFLLLVSLYPYTRTSNFEGTTVTILTGLIFILVVALVLLRRGYLTASGLIIIILGWLGIGLQALTADGVKDVIIMAYIAIGLLASIVISWWAGGVVILASIGVLWGLALIEANGLFTPRYQDPIIYARDISFVFLIISALIYFSTTSLRDAINRANKSEESLLASNRKLQELNQNLEERVSDRTFELEAANRRNQRRAAQFEAISQIARATTSNETLETLLPRLSVLISDRFGFYHTGVFLLDDERTYAVLRAANSPGGQRMLARGHKLSVGQTGIVGFVSATGSPRIALDVGTDAVFFDNPDLPNTRSEMALPLRVADEIIGVLDIQSTEPNAFDDEDTDILSTLADQAAIAIQNSRTYEAMRDLLSSAQRASGAYFDEAWRTLQTEDTKMGYIVVGNELQPLISPLASASVRKAVEKKEIVRENGDEASLTIPIRLRGEVIGVMDIRSPDNYQWDDDEVDIAAAVADRLALALESSLLLKSTQRRAELERITTDISVKLGASTQFDAILRTAAEELSKVLGGSEVLVQIQSFEESDTTGKPESHS